MSNLQTYYHFKLDFQKVDQHAGGKWLIHGSKRRKVAWKYSSRLGSLHVTITGNGRMHMIYGACNICMHIIGNIHPLTQLL